MENHVVGILISMSVTTPSILHLYEYSTIVTQHKFEEITIWLYEQK